MTMNYIIAIFVFGAIVAATWLVIRAGKEREKLNRILIENERRNRALRKLVGR